MTTDERKQAAMDFYDLMFNQNQPQIVEHWDVLQAIPETSKNDNGMF